MTYNNIACSLEGTKRGIPAPPQTSTKSSNFVDNQREQIVRESRQHVARRLTTSISIYSIAIGKHASSAEIPRLVITNSASAWPNLAVSRLSLLHQGIGRNLLVPGGRRYISGTVVHLFNKRKEIIYKGQTRKRIMELFKADVVVVDVA